jgi:hypothetical protein
MVIGYDAYGDKTSQKKVGAIVCSTNSTQTEFMSFAIIQDAEICNEWNAHIRF